MQTSFPNYSRATELFTRERRRQRMLQFIETFDRRSWASDPEQALLLPFSKADIREPALAPHHRASR
ncbi:MAG: hypothetical protein EXS37_03490 [Opitutus sp.]|nr:hypothetical protein [Opitutus sp.]